MPMTQTAGDRDARPDAMSLSKLPFDTQVFGAPVFRLSVDDTTEGADLACDLETRRLQWSALDAWLVMCRVDRDRPDADAVDAALAAMGFVEVETLMTFERPVSPGSGAGPTTVVPALPEHLTGCVRIAGEVFCNSRYHTDGRIDRKRADELKRSWVRNSFAGRADTILVATDEAAGDRVAGFNALRLIDTTAVIDLIAVSGDCRRRGLGRDLVDAAVSAFAGRADRLRVGTQAANLPSQALYRSCGFTEVGLAKTFHWIRPDSGRSARGVA